MNLQQAYDTLKEGKRVRYKTTGREIVFNTDYDDNSIIWEKSKFNLKVNPYTLKDVWELIKEEKEEDNWDLNHAGRVNHLRGKAYLEEDVKLLKQKILEDLINIKEPIYIPRESVEKIINRRFGL